MKDPLIEYFVSEVFVWSAAVLIIGAFLGGWISTSIYHENKIEWEAVYAAKIEEIVVCEERIKTLQAYSSGVRCFPWGKEHEAAMCQRYCTESGRHWGDLE